MPPASRCETRRAAGGGSRAPFSSLRNAPAPPASGGPPHPRRPSVSCCAQQRHGGGAKEALALRHRGRSQRRAAGAILRRRSLAPTSSSATARRLRSRLRARQESWARRRLRRGVAAIGSHLRLSHRRVADMVPETRLGRLDRRVGVDLEPDGQPPIRVPQATRPLPSMFAPSPMRSEAAGAPSLSLARRRNSRRGVEAAAAMPKAQRPPPAIESIKPRQRFTKLKYNCHRGAIPSA